MRRWRRPETPACRNGAAALGAAVSTRCLFLTLITVSLAAPYLRTCLVGHAHDHLQSSEVDLVVVAAQDERRAVREHGDRRERSSFAKFRIRSDCPRATSTISTAR